MSAKLIILLLASLYRIQARNLTVAVKFCNLTDNVPGTWENDRCPYFFECRNISDKYKPVVPNNTNETNTTYNNVEIWTG